MRPPLDPDRSHDRRLTPDVAVRWWGASKNLDLYWCAPAHGDSAHPTGTPLLRVTGTLSRDEALGLYQFLGQLLGPGVRENE